MISYEFIGVDVAKDKFDVAFENKTSITFHRDNKGLKLFLKWLKANTLNPWVCMEATGGYSEFIAEFLAQQQVKVTIANPMQVKNFCRAKLLRNKNDNVDAQAVAEYARLMPLREYQVRSDDQKSINEFNKLLDALKKQVRQLENQLETTQDNCARKMIKKIIKDLGGKIEEIEKNIANRINNSNKLKENFELMTSIPGIGKLTAYQILGMVDDINAFKNAKEFAAFIGLSPRQHQSGKFNGTTRISKVGNPRLRKAFYMASLSAKKYNPNLQAFVGRLGENGKAPKSIICAVMRKLAHLIFGVLKNKKPFIVGYEKLNTASSK